MKCNTRRRNGVLHGVVRGDAVVPALSYTGTVDGTSTFSADFGSDTFTSTLNLVANDSAHSSIGSFDFGGTIAHDGDGNSNFFGNTSAYPAYAGQMNGGFFGPNADEFGAVWTLLQDGPSGRMTAYGAAAGKKD